MEREEHLGRDRGHAAHVRADDARSRETGRRKFVSDANAAQAIARLLEVMRLLREKCPWDREQTFSTIAPYTIEEAYEVAEAIARGEPRALEGELGDLLFQVVFHAQMGAERAWFDFASVANAISDKVTARHPHVFADATVADAAAQTLAWEEYKARERAALVAASGKPPSELADVPLALPALARAAKLGKRAGRVGFDWPDATGVRGKIDEELRETDEATDDSHRAEEIGDLLFAVANWSRHLGIDPEESLRLANAKFERRFRAMEALAASREFPLKSLDAAAWDALWNEVKTSFSQDSSTPA
ncbi:MAG: nucleoside triphosphate pyrophosphohydrolase [Steroidobacteraceae bacterium]|nr:nucleoside triphosphate pyrophosphohydrolase [Steroidobacteraceae bacterium]